MYKLSKSQKQTMKRFHRFLDTGVVQKQMQETDLANDLGNEKDGKGKSQEKIPSKAKEN